MALDNDWMKRNKRILAKKKYEVQRPLPPGRIAHLQKQIKRIEDLIKKAQQD